MEKILINCPLNINRSLLNMLKEFVEQEYGKDLFVIINEQHHYDHKSTLLNSFKQGELPIMYIGMPLDFAQLTRQEITDNFASIKGLPLRSELLDKGFKDDNGYFNIFTIVPFAIIFNKNIARRFPAKWLDFTDIYYAKKIRLPIEQLPVSRVTSALMKNKFPDKFDAFLNNCEFAGSPIDVVNAVDNGEYEYGMVNLSFSRVSRQKNTDIIWLDEGLSCMPLVVMVRKDELNRVKKIVEYLFSQEVQEFMALQSFIPVLAEIKLPTLIEENRLNIIWDNWDAFLEGLRGCSGKEGNV